EWYSKAAAQNYADAQNNLAALYAQGKGVELNNKKAFELYSKAAEQGNEKAQNNLGAIYALGIGVNQDYKKAF
ncbi:tetratricopeptide repeat protein, partial [Acinetobacter baumannii]